MKKVGQIRYEGNVMFFRGKAGGNSADDLTQIHKKYCIKIYMRSCEKCACLSGRDSVCALNNSEWVASMHGSGCSTKLINKG